MRESHIELRARPGVATRSSAYLGITIGLFLAIAALRLVPRREAREPSDDATPIAGTLAREDGGSLGEVLFHYVPSLAPIVGDTYRDWLSALDPRTRLVVVVPRGSIEDARSFLAFVDARLLERARFVEVDGPITEWSKDRALVAMPLFPGDRTTLVVPVPPDSNWIERAHDWATIPAVASAMPDRFVVRELPIDFDAGDFTVTYDRVLLDANLVAKNAQRGPRFASVTSLCLLAARLFSRPCVALGTSPGDVPRHHMSMYMTPAPSPSSPHAMLVGDPRLALGVAPRDYAPGPLSPDTAEPLVADFSSETIARFDHAAHDLTAAGFDVVRVPVIPFDDKTYITYTNGIVETRPSGERVAYVPAYGFDDATRRLDAIARSAYERLSWKVVPVRVAAPWVYHGTLGCLANVTARGS